MSLKDNLIRIMKRNSLKIKDLSREAGISEPTLKRLRTDDNSNPTLDVLMRLSIALGEPIDVLVANISEEIPVFNQGVEIDVNNLPQKFIVLIMIKTFDIAAGTKALFEKYTGKQKITRYVLGVDAKIYQKLDNDFGHYLTEQQKVIAIEPSQILAIINSEIYKVDYAQI